MLLSIETANQSIPTRKKPMKMPAATSELAAMTTISSEGIFFAQDFLDEKFPVRGKGKPETPCPSDNLSAVGWIATLPAPFGSALYVEWYNFERFLDSGRRKVKLKPKIR